MILFISRMLDGHGAGTVSRDFYVLPSRELNGRFRVPGDKSISHRAIMLAALAEGESVVDGFLAGEDCLATMRAFRQMGVTIHRETDERLRIQGVGMGGLKAPDSPLDMGNSGTAMRLMTGLLAGQAFDSELVGDASLQSRPMKRVTDPLTAMGAVIETAEGGRAPLTIRGGQSLQAIDYTLPMASAQVKSCLLLAGMYARGVTRVREPAATRDHSERMLQGFGYSLERQGLSVAISGGGRLTATDVVVPADISSAAFFLVGASIAEKADVELFGVGINPTRDGVIQILRQMGARIEVVNQRESGGEPVADLRIRSAELNGIDIPEQYVASAIDEFPALFVAAACAEGQTVLRGARELRVKECDRIQVMADGLLALGINAEPLEDGMVIQGSGTFRGGEVNSHGDHRIAMAFAMASLRASAAIVVRDCDNVNTSFPGFVPLAQQMGVNVQ